MGRYQAARIIVREVDDIKLVFWDKYSIYLSWNKQRYVFHRWYSPKGTYSEWRKFKLLLLHRRHLNYRDVFELADRYGVLFRHAVGHLNWREKPVEIRFSNIRIIGVSDDVQNVLRE